MTNQVSATGVLSLFETTKDQRSNFVSEIVDRIDNGDVDPLKIHLQVKAMEDIISRLTVRDEKKNKDFEFAKRYNSAILETAQEYGSKSFQAFNGKFEIKEVGTKYDFSKCEDKELFALYEKMDELKKKVKDREDMLKTIPLSGLVITDQESGETYTVYPPAKSSTTSVSVSLY